MLPARDNPFATHRVLRERYRLDGAGWAVLFARLRARAFRGAIVGPQGSGKTTLLEDLRDRLVAEGWRVTLVRLQAESREWPEALTAGALARCDARDVLLLDGAEQLSRWRWWRFRRHARHLGGIVVTVHAPGRLPTVWRCATSPELLRDLVSSLGVALDERSAAELHARHRGNVRTALRELYDRHAEQHVG